MPKTAKKYYAVQLPCKPYIRKYVQGILGEHIKVDHSSTLGSFIALTLCKEIYENRNLSNSVRYAGMTSSLTLLVNKWQSDKIGFSIEQDKLFLINKHLEKTFEEDLYKHCRRFEKFKITAPGTDKDRWLKDAIYDFADEYKIDLLGDTDHSGNDVKPDISFDGLKRKEFRIRKAIEKRNRKVEFTTLFA